MYTEAIEGEMPYINVVKSFSLTLLKSTGAWTSSNSSSYVTLALAGTSGDL